ncbi:MAG: type II toxin-antitoxin system HicA family toxin [Acidiferrobacterales bacterium]
MVEREDNLYVAVRPERDIGDGFRSGAWVNCAVLSGRDVCRVLEKHGFAEVRRRGSHIVMQRRVEAGSATVPVPDHPEPEIGTLRSVIRQSGSPRSEFESWSGRRIWLDSGGAYRV